MLLSLKSPKDFLLRFASIFLPKIPRDLLSDSSRVSSLDLLPFTQKNPCSSLLALSLRSPVDETIADNAGDQVARTVAALIALDRPREVLPLCLLAGVSVFFFTYIFFSCLHGYIYTMIVGRVMLAHDSLKRPPNLGLQFPESDSLLLIEMNPWLGFQFSKPR